MYDENYLAHYGIKGMKWGVRRYQNKDGTLTAKGKKRLSKDFKDLTNKAREDLDKNSTKRYVDAYNKAADDMNNGLIDKYNADYDKKLGSKAKGHDYENDKDYNDGYEKLFSDRFVKYYNTALLNEITSNKNYRKAQELCDQYGMTKFDDFARDSQTEIDEIRRSLS